MMDMNSVRFLFPRSYSVMNLILIEFARKNVHLNVTQLNMKSQQLRTIIQLYRMLCHCWVN